MDGVLPQSTCYKNPICGGGGGTWVSNNFIRGRGQVTFPTLEYDLGWEEDRINNPPPTTLYVRAAPSRMDANKTVFWINGLERPRLILTRGKKYQFNISTCGFPFYFSDAQGNNISGVPASDFDMRTYTINPQLPEAFYYKCSLYEDMGGQVVLRG